MPIEFSPDLINAFSFFVVTLDQHPAGAVALVAVLLAGGIAVAVARWGQPKQSKRRRNKR